MPYSSYPLWTAKQSSHLFSQGSTTSALSAVPTHCASSWVLLGLLFSCRSQALVFKCVQILYIPKAKGSQEQARRVYLQVMLLLLMALLLSLTTSLKSLWRGRHMPWLWDKAERCVMSACANFLTRTGIQSLALSWLTCMQICIPFTFLTTWRFWQAFLYWWNRDGVPSLQEVHALINTLHFGNCRN